MSRIFENLCSGKGCLFYKKYFFSQISPPHDFPRTLITQTTHSVNIHNKSNDENKYTLEK